MTAISYIKPYGGFTSTQAIKVDGELIKKRLKNFLDNKPNFSDGFIISDVEYKNEFKRKISHSSLILHALQLSKSDFINTGNKRNEVEVKTNVYIALIYHRKGNKVFFDFAPYFVSMNVYQNDKYDFSVTFYPHDIDVINDAVALGAEAEVMKISSDSSIQNSIPDILYKNFIAATEVIYDICEDDLFLFNK